MSAKHELIRCTWSTSDPLYLQYHDEEWGVPLHDDQKLFELLVLEGMQAGLSWITILKKRENFRKAFDNFNPDKIIKYNDAKINKLLSNEGIIRNRLKINSVIKNAEAYLKVKKEFGSFDNYIWQFTGNKQLKNKWASLKDIPPKTKESDNMSKDLKRRDFTFVGSTICYAFMQASGMVNDHITTCFRYKQINP